MITPKLSGSLGNIQLMSFTDAENESVIKQTVAELGLSHTHISTGSVVEATAYLKENSSPELLLVEVRSAENAPDQLDALADVTNQHTHVMVTGKIDSIRFYQWLSELGIEGYLLQPFTADELKQAVSRNGNKKMPTSPAGDEHPPKIIAIIGARGGVGTTMVATNLGALLAREHALATAIIDLDPYFGSVALGLDLDPARGLRDAFEKPDRIDSLFLERVMVKPFANLSVFSDEEPLMDTIVTQPNAGEMMFGALREKFRVMVVDVPRQMNSLTRYVLANADQTVIIAEPQITSLRDSLRLKDYLVDQLKRPAPLLLLNRVGLSGKNELSPKGFAKHFGQEISGQMPYIAEIIAATAQGQLLTDNQKLTAALAPLRTLAQAVTGYTTENTALVTAAGEGSIFARLRGKK